MEWCLAGFFLCIELHARAVAILSGGGSQEEAGGTSRSQEQPGGARRSQEEPGGARRSQGEPGGARPGFTWLLLAPPGFPFFGLEDWFALLQQLQPGALAVVSKQGTVIAASSDTAFAKECTSPTKWPELNS